MPFLAPLGVAIGAAWTSIGIVGHALVGIGLNVVVSKIQAARAKKVKAASAGTQFDREYGEDVSRKVLAGRVGVAGHDCYVNTYAKANKNLEQVFVFSDYPCDALEKIWAGGTELNLVLLGVTGAVSDYAVSGGDYAGRMFFRFYDGTQTTADADMVNNSNPAGRWTNSHIGTGICWVKVSLIYDQEKLSSFPDFFFQIRGARLYDIRKDSSVGGSGAHRWGVYSTHQFSENPIIQDYNYRRGFSINGDLFCGMGMPSSDLPIDRYATAANICDEVVASEARYRCSIILDADTDHGDNIDALMLACGGMVIDSVDGSWPLVGTAQPIVETFTDDDLVSGEPVRYRAKRSQADLTNAVSGTYPEPSNMWSPVGYDTQTDSNQVALDRRARDVSLDLGTVPSKRQANQLAAIYYNENRYEATAELVLRPRFQTIKAGDWVVWNSARYGSRTYMVQSRSIRALTTDGPRNVSLSLQQRDGAIYAGAGVIASTIPLPNGQPLYLNELQDFAPIPVLTVAEDGRTYPAFRLSWSPIDDVTVTGVAFEWWVVTAPTDKFSRLVQADKTLEFVQEGILNTTDYQFRHRLIADRVTNWSAPVTVRSLDGGNGDLTVLLTNLNKEVMDLFDVIIDKTVTATADIEQLTIDFGTIAAGGELQRQVLRQQIGDSLAQIIEERTVRATADEAAALISLQLDAKIAGANASIVQEQGVRATADMALAQVSTNLGTQIETVSSGLVTEISTRATQAEALSQSISTLNASVGANTSAIATEVSARTTADSAIADIANAASVQAGDASAQGLMKMSLLAAPAGITARFSQSFSASLGGASKQMGQFFDIYTVGGVLKSRIAQVTDEFILTDGTSEALPFYFSGSTAYMQNIKVQWADIVNANINWANIGTAVIGNLIVGTSNIPTGLINAMNIAEGPGISAPATFTTSPYTLDVVLSHGAGSPKVKLEAYGSTALATGAGFTICRLISVEDGTTIATWTGSAEGRGSFAKAKQHIPPAGRSSTTYRLQVNANSAATGGANSQIADATIMATSFNKAG